MHLVFTYSLFSVEIPSQVIVPGTFQVDFEVVQSRFAQLFYQIAVILDSEESVTLDKLKQFTSNHADLSYSLDNVNSISDVINRIQKHSSFARVGFLEGFVKEFCPFATEKIEKYLEFVEEFCNQKLIHHIYMKQLLTSHSMCFTPSTTITFKLRWNPAEKTLSDIQELLLLAFEKQSIYVDIVVVKGGSVRVICYAPQHLMTELVRLAQRNRELLVDSSVTYLRVGDTIVVDTSDQNEVRICYHRNCVTLDFQHQISLVKDLVLQLTIALQLKGELKVCLLLNTNILLLLQITDFLRVPDSQGMVIHCMCPCCSHSYCAHGS